MRGRTIAKVMPVAELFTISLLSMRFSFFLRACVNSFLLLGTIAVLPITILVREIFPNTWLMM
jgi:hypothetical protein